MTEELRIAMLQFDIKWKQKEENFRIIESAIPNDGLKADLLILPELFSSGFVTDDNTLAESEEGPSVKWLKESSITWGTCIMGSLMIQEEEKTYNRLLAIKEGEIIFRYDKRHLFGMGGESRFFSPGPATLRSSFTACGWKIRPQICYDLRFPVWSRNDDDYDALITVANWPAPRIAAWKVLLQARAVENQAFSIGLNRLGVDGYGLRYPGESCAYDPEGNLILQSGETAMLRVSLNRSSLVATRKKLPFLNDRDVFKILEDE